MQIAPRPFFLLIACHFFLPAVIGQEIRSINVISGKLQKIVLNEDDLPYDVPPEARVLLPDWKLGIRQVAQGVLSDSKKASYSAAQIRSSIVDALAKEGVSLSTDSHPYYGQLLRLEVSSDKLLPDLMTVTSTINLECGGDSSVQVFQKGSGIWKLVMSLTAGNYAQIDGAREALAFRFSTTGNSNSWFMVLAYSHPWCTSCWSGLHYQVLRPSANPDKPEILYEADRGFYRCAAMPFLLSVSPYEFSIVYPSAFAFDPNLSAKISVDRFFVRQAGVLRAPPLRQNAVAFVDEWIGMPDKEAVGLVAPQAAESAQLWHSKLSGLANMKPEYSFESSYEFEQECNDDHSRWQVKLKLDSKQGRIDPEIPPAIFFVLNVGNQGTILQRVGIQEDITCKGKSAHPEAEDINNLDRP